MDIFMQVLESSSRKSRHAKQSNTLQNPKLKPQLPAPLPPPPSGPPLLASSRRPARQIAGSSTNSLMSERPNEAGPTDPLQQPVDAPASSVQSLLPDLLLYEKNPPNPEDSLPNELPAEREEPPNETLNILQPPIPVIDDQPSILIGVSGIASSGKTTLAHLLLLIIPPTTPVFLLHQDDYLVPKNLLVPSRNGELDADGPSAIDFASLKRALKYVKREGKLPSTFHTMQPEADEHMRAVSLVSQDELDDLKALIIRSELFQAGRPVGIVDGSWLYHDPTVRSLLDVKIVLRASREISRQRHFEKPESSGSELGDDFSRTTDYYDKVIWPRYSEEHGPLFENGDVQDRPILGLCEELGIVIQPELDFSVPEALKWMTESIIKHISNQRFLKTRNTTPTSQRYQICDREHGWLGKFRQTLFDLL